MLHSSTMHRLLTAIRFNSKSCSFAANLCTKFELPVIQELEETNNFPEKQVDFAIAKIPGLEKFTRDQWQKTFETLNEQGFSSTRFMKIVLKRPQLLRISRDKLRSSMNTLQIPQFGNKKLFDLVEKYPELLEYNDKHGMRRRIAFLRAYAGTDSNVHRLFLASLNLLTDPEEAIQKKIDYLHLVMKVDETEASKSSVFSYSLDEIKCRHVFLSRLGLFKPKNPKVDRLQPTKNPRMTNIFDTSDREFAVKTCRATLEEFETFRELYKREKVVAEDNEEERISSYKK